MNQDMDLDISLSYMHYCLDILHWLSTLAYSLVDFQCIVADNYKKDNFHSFYIQNMAHTVMGHRDLLVLVHLVEVEVTVEPDNIWRMGLQYIQGYMYILDDVWLFCIVHFDHIVQCKDQYNVGLCMQGFVNNPDWWDIQVDNLADFQYSSINMNIRLGSWLLDIDYVVRMEKVNMGLLVHFELVEME